MEKSVKKYRYRFSVLSYVLFGIGFALALFVIIHNIYRISSGKATGEYVGSLTISIVIAIIFIAFALSVLACSFYTITKTHIKTRLGVICTGIKINELTEIVYIKSSDKLAVFYKDGEFSNIVISSKHFDTFVNELKTYAPNIIYKIHEND